MFTLLERIVGGGGVGGILNSLVSHWVVSQLQSHRERERVYYAFMLMLAYECL